MTDSETPLAPLEPTYMEALLAHVSAQEPKAVAVMVLAGSPDEGLSISVFSHQDEDETRTLFNEAAKSL